jgi:cell fate (sporulation/competence/biofilm development) regulator YlbF (YheA/YmcA/DUF963 family)
LEVAVLYCSGKTLSGREHQRLTSSDTLPDDTMQLSTEDTVVMQKTKELCQAIVDQPEFQKLRQDLDTFMSNDEVRGQYQALSEKGEYLQHKQQTGGQLADDEIAQFESDRQSFLNNPVARGFLDAQQEMNRVQESVTHYVTKTFELGRVPEESDFESCGHGCNCHH